MEGAQRGFGFRLLSAAIFDHLGSPFSRQTEGKGGKWCCFWTGNNDITYRF